MQWFYFSIWRSGQWHYIGKCQSSLETIRETFPWCEIEGNHVKIYAVGKIRA